jgi:hypothetical protein
MRTFWLTTSPPSGGTRRKLCFTQAKHFDVAARDYTVSFLIGALAPVNGVSIVQERGRRFVTYHHVELPAEGCGAESYLDIGNRAFFEAGSPVTALHPSLTMASLTTAGAPPPCAPLCGRGRGRWWRPYGDD